MFDLYEVNVTGLYTNFLTFHKGVIIPPASKQYFSHSSTSTRIIRRLFMYINLHLERPGQTQTRQFVLCGSTVNRFCFCSVDDNGDYALAYQEMMKILN